MNKRAGNGSKAPLPSESADRLLDLVASFANLRSNNRLLLSQLRSSIDELRQLRTGLRSPQGPDLVQHHRRRMGPAERFGLTRRERQVATLLAEGRSNQAIARELQISAHTARHHTQRILAKLEVHSRAEAGAKIRS